MRINTYVATTTGSSRLNGLLVDHSITTKVAHFSHEMNDRDHQQRHKGGSRHGRSATAAFSVFTDVFTIGFAIALCRRVQR